MIVGTGFSPPLCRVDSLGGFGTVRRLVLVARGFLLVGLTALVVRPAMLLAGRVVVLGIGLARNCFLHSSARFSSVLKEEGFLVVLAFARRDTESAEGATDRRAEFFGALFSFAFLGRGLLL